MSEVIIAERYAKAFCESGGSDSNDPETMRSKLKALNFIVTIFEVDAAQKVLMSPVMPMDLKKELLNYARVKSGAGETDSHISGLIEVVVNAKRVALFPRIVGAIKKHLDREAGIITAELTSAVELGPDELKAITSSLETLMGKTIELSTMVDPCVLGGVVVKMGHHLLDLSIRAKLDAITETAAV